MGTKIDQHATIAIVNPRLSLAVYMRMEQTPPRDCVVYKTQSLPLMPNLLAAISDAMPPRARAKIFDRENTDPSTEANSKSRLNWSCRYGAMLLSTVSSTPKQYPYVNTRIHVL